VVRNEFWSVKVGVGMGPLVLGTQYGAIVESLQEQGVEVERLTSDRLDKLLLQAIQTELVFSEGTPRTLRRIDVSDKRIRFGSLPVIGKRAHEIVGLFKVSRKETIWSSLDPREDSAPFVANDNTTERSRELLARGTIWVKTLGLGLTLRDGLVATVHLCDPADSPTAGTGPWTKEQQLLSEVREIPVDPTIQNQRSTKMTASLLIHLGLFVSTGVLVWWVIQLQNAWNVAIEAPALVVELDPPPPHPLPDNITVLFNDTNGMETRTTLGHMQFERAPKLDDTVMVRYLPNKPDKVLGPVAWRDVGFSTAFPYGIGIFVTYCILQLIFVGKLPFRSPSRRSSSSRR
jgi:hypothetical protein